MTVEEGKTTTTPEVPAQSAGGEAPKPAESAAKAPVVPAKPKAAKTAKAPAAQAQKPAESAADSKRKGPKQYRAKVMCFDGKLFKAGETRVSTADLDPNVWEEV